MVTVYIKNPCEMKRIIFLWMVLVGITLIISCNSGVKSDVNSKMVAENRILQQKDGTVSLKIDKADCYHDVLNPSTNTAEWNVVFSRSGRYDVWLSSATKDTTDLKYKNSVLLSVRDNRLETRPIISRVVQNSTDVSRPYYQADSFMGSLYIQDTGVYDVQVISDKILPKSYKTAEDTGDAQTKILSVLLTPVKHDSLK